MTFPALSSFCLFDLDDGFEERALALRFNSEAGGIDGEAGREAIVAEVISSYGGRDVDGVGGAPTGELNANGTTNF